VPSGASVFIYVSREGKDVATAAYFKILARCSPGGEDKIRRRKLRRTERKKNAQEICAGEFYDLYFSANIIRVIE
jgi:hypothetical protein